MKPKIIVLALMLLVLAFEGYREMSHKSDLPAAGLTERASETLTKKQTQVQTILPKKSERSSQMKISNWYELQIEAAPEWVRQLVATSIREKGPCAEGFSSHYTTPVDPKVAFKADYMAIIVQLQLYIHQFCDTSCSDTLFQYSRTFQGLGSRYHTHMCSFDSALRYNKNFISLNGQWLFADPSKCRDSNDHCYFNKVSKCPMQFCSSAKNAGQDCRMMMHLPPDTEEKCDQTCLCGSCGVSPGHHETVWGKHSCNSYRDLPEKIKNVTILGEHETSTHEDQRTHLWWSSQLLFFLMQPGDELRTMIEEDITHHPFITDSNSVVNIHVRRGRLKQPEMSRFFDLKEYKDVAIKKFGKKKFFIQTNDPVVIEETTEPKNNDVEWGYTTWNRTGKDLQIHNDPKKYKRRKAAGMLVDPKEWTLHSFKNLWLMLRTQYWVCTYSSNWCRLALRLAFATYGVLPETLSLDDWSFDPYKWYQNSYVETVIKRNR
eukprot:TRINITY_DN5384_c1_g4_i1.p1 TRINITY_DN5384_c1_g4~~TRINITY_DN5384_c1_g4_i1.p1  ORF type:complete len:501 (+),score=75.95 TRINITY_DN5384_c1_g4_i1:39-1505(+)